jgi:hypothetical protein
VGLASHWDVLQYFGVPFGRQCLLIPSHSLSDVLLGIIHRGPKNITTGPIILVKTHSIIYWGIHDSFLNCLQFDAVQASLPLSIQCRPPPTEGSDTRLEVGGYPFAYNCNVNQCIGRHAVPFIGCASHHYMGDHLVQYAALLDKIQAIMKKLSTLKSCARSVISPR